MGRGRARAAAEDPHRPVAQAPARRDRRRRRPRAAARRGDRRRRRRATAAASSRSSTRPRPRVLGIFRELPSGGGRLVPVDKKQLGKELAIAPDATKGAKDGDLIAVSVVRSGRFGLAAAQVEERLGSLKSERAVSVIAIHAHEIPNVFPPAVLEDSGRRQARRPRRPRGLAQDSAGHHRSRRRQGSRRRGLRRTRHRSAAIRAAM